MEPRETAAHGRLEMDTEDAYSLTDVPRLTTALKAGCEDAFTWLHRAWSHRINRHCFALAAGDSGLAGDVAQGIWLRLVKHIRPLPDEAALWAWITCAAKHALIDLRRSRGRYRKVLDRFTAWWELRQFTGRGAEAEDAESLLLQTLDRALAMLTPEERELVEARYFHGESLEQTGQRLGLTQRAVEGRLARLRTRLRDLMLENTEESQS